MSSKGLVLVTGLNGYIGARTVEAFLKAGYSVRGTVRSKASSIAVEKALSEFSDRLEIVEVPDITVPGAFDAALKGVDGVAHLAAPVSFSLTLADIKVGEAATRSILDSASKESSIKSFVLMSSVTAIQSRRPGPYVFTEKDWNDQAAQLVAQMGDKTPGPVIYSASKTAAEKVFWEFRETKKPNFAMSSVNPVFVTGPPLLTPTSERDMGETYVYIWEVYSGKEIPEPLAGFAWFVDVRDVGRCFVSCIEHSDKANGERFLLCGAYGPPQAAADILREAYPERRSIIKVGKPGAGYKPGFKPLGDLDVDGTKAVKTLGLNYTPYEQSIVDAAKVFEPLL